MSKKNQVKLLSVILVVGLGGAGYQLFSEHFRRELIAENTLKIGITTDVQSYSNEDKETGAWKVNWRMKDALERFVLKMNKEFNPDIVVDIGDLVDGKDHRSYKSWEQAREIISKVEAPIYYVLGNHETGRFLKSKWLELTGHDSTYYYKDIKKGETFYRLIMIDSNHSPDNTDTTPEKRYYPGYINEEEWQWLERTLQNAMQKEKNILVFIHHPPLNIDSWPNWGIFPQGEKLQKLFSKYHVRAVFSGHIEQMCFEKNRETKYFVLQGLWKSKGHLKKEYRFKNAGNFYYAIITPDDIIIKSEYRIFKNDKYKKENVAGWRNEIISDNDKYNCQDRHQLSENKTIEKDINN